jgi:predicted nucleic-acid-binding Zn-ribbon protein
MRESHRCPKCSHGEIFFVPQLADRDDDDRVHPLVLHVGAYDYWGDKDKQFGQIQAYVCAKCGYTELYTKDASSLGIHKLPGVQILKAKE